MTLVVKLGSSVVAADDGSLRADVLDSVCAQVSELERAGERVVLVTSGAIARGMRLLDLKERPRAMDELQACSAVGQGDLFQAYRQRLEAGGTKAAQVLLTLSDISERSHYTNVRQSLDRLLRWNVVPIVNENDTTATDEITFGDNDFLAALLAALMEARLLVLLTNIDGVFTGDPRSEPDAEFVSRIDDSRTLFQVKIGASSHLGRGGMQSKITSARIASESGVPVVICNGTRPGELEAVARGSEVGTHFSARAEGIPAYKLWLKHAKQPTGTIEIDHGAAQRLRESGSSLLPVGIIGSNGTFRPGDAVWVVGENDPEPLGKGIAEYSSWDVARTEGRNSAYIREHFPDAPEEVIHRDRFVLL